MARKKTDFNSEVANFKRNQIVKTAMKIFMEKGYSATSISDIASELGIAHGTVYNYFKTKSEIFTFVIEEIIMQISSTMTEENPAASNTLEEYRAQVGRIGENLFGVVISNPLLANLMFYESWGLDAEMRERALLLMDGFGLVTEQYLINGVAKGFLRADLDTRRMAYSVNAIIMEAGRRIIGSEDKAAEKSKWLACVEGMMFDGAKK